MEIDINIELDGERALALLRLLSNTPVGVEEVTVEPVIVQEVQPETEDAPVEEHPCPHCGRVFKTLRARCGHEHGCPEKNKDRTVETREEVDEHVPLTGAQRKQFARERRAIVGEMITQPGWFEGAEILEHIRGSQYVVQLSEKTPFTRVTCFAYHKKQDTHYFRRCDELNAGWKVWVEHQESTAWP